MRKKRGAKGIRAKQAAEIAARLRSCGPVEFAIIESLVWNARVRNPRRRERHWDTLGAKWPIIIGAEPVIIGLSDAWSPPYYAPGEAMRQVAGPAIEPEPRVIDEGAWWDAAFVRGLRTDLNLVYSLVSLAIGMACWFWLAHGGAAWVLSAGGEVRLAMWVPSLLSVVAVAFMTASIVPELDLAAMRLQRGC